jgi:sugar phosphate isomerase/epimerase
MIRDVLPQLRAAGVVLAIENYFDIDDGDLAGVVDGIDDELVGICFDTANSTGLLRDPATTAALLAPRAASVHLKDFVVQKLDAGYRTAGVPLGRGWLDVRGTLAQISRSPRRPHILLELWVEPDADLEATARKEWDWLAASLDYARHLLSEGARVVTPLAAQE